MVQAHLLLLGRALQLLMAPVLQQWLAMAQGRPRTTMPDQPRVQPQGAAAGPLQIQQAWSMQLCS